MAANEHSLVAVPGAARAFIPPTRDWDEVREAARSCCACPLHRIGTQTVFGEGPVPAPLLLIGEQPGDAEDRAGHPFVGPAGQLLDRALAEAGIERSQAYVTNAVKHFKWEPRGKRRIHSKPSAREVGACLPWLDAELELVRPDLVVLLGATAAQALLGRSFRVTRDRGRIVSDTAGRQALATIHPSAVLRARDAARQAEFAAFVDDLKMAAEFLSQVA